MHKKLDHAERLELLEALVSHMEAYEEQRVCNGAELWMWYGPTALRGTSQTRENTESIRRRRTDGGHRAAYYNSTTNHL